MRIVFMGTPDFAIPSLEILLENGYEIPAVVTAPDKPAGRGQEIVPSPVKNFALRRKIRVLQPEKLDDDGFVASIREAMPDLLVVVAFRIIPPAIFTLPKHGSINLHASLLPKYRGAAPINWAIIRGEKETGVTTFFLKERVDTGDIILQARLPIGPDESAGQLHDRLATVGAEVVLHSARLIESGKAVMRSQDESFATSAPKIYKKDCQIDWAKSSLDVHNLVRGLSPRPGAFTRHSGLHLKIYRTRILADPPTLKPGEVDFADAMFIVGSGDGAVEILEIQQEGKKKLTAREFLLGYKLKKGEMLA